MITTSSLIIGIRCTNIINAVVAIVALNFLICLLLISANIRRFFTPRFYHTIMVFISTTGRWKALAIKFQTVKLPNIIKDCLLDALNDGNAKAFIYVLFVVLFVLS